jgi:hypothetical protein
LQQTPCCILVARSFSETSSTQTEETELFKEEAKKVKSPKAREIVVAQYEVEVMLQILLHLFLRLSSIHRTLHDGLRWASFTLFALEIFIAPATLLVIHSGWMVIGCPSIATSRSRRGCAAMWATPYRIT